MKNVILNLTFVKLAWLACVASAAAASQVDTWEFEVLLDDRKIGYHRFDLSTSENRLILETEASFDVRVLFINAFRYRHENTEIWDNGCLSSIDAVTDNNGDDLFVRGSASGRSFVVTSSERTSEIDGCVRTFAYWNPAILEADRLLNSQTGEYEAVTVRLEATEELEVEGRMIDALRYSLATPGGEIRLWYSRDDRRWLALEAPARGERKIRYLPRLVPSRPPQGIVLASND